MKITEYTIVEQKGVGKKVYIIKLGENMFFRDDDPDTGIKVVDDIGWAKRITSEKFALEMIGYLQNFYDDEGNIRPENRFEKIPPLVGLAEAAEMLGWDKRQISTYINRGKFPEPIQRLASGPIWTYKQIEDYRDARK
ncbi:helix-turn-helix transcriptional regulator [Brevibacillus panacihumi]|uniref:helix-turn-helix transcriptional regulator n=1 Tax=Brevibacillus panacihumi TaxID=497735 RepID=UPI003D222273